MTQEEKDLLLKDLCGRLLYNPIVEYSYKFEDIDKGEKKRVLTGRMIDSYFYNIVLGGTKVTSIKPYLRPMSSMTNDERFEYLDFLKVEIQDGGYVTENYVVSLADMPMLIDWLLKHHFDYRGLIKMGLALEAPEGMYNF